MSDALRRKVHNIFRDYVTGYSDETVDGIVALVASDKGYEKAVSNSIAHLIADPDAERYLLPILTPMITDAIKARKLEEAPNALRGKVSHILSDHVGKYVYKTVGNITTLVTGDESDEEIVRDAIEQAIGNPNMGELLPKLTSTVLSSIRDEKSARILDEVRRKVRNILCDLVMEYFDETVDGIVALAAGDETDETVVSDAIAYVMSDPDIEEYVLPDLTSIVVNAVKTRKSMGMPDTLSTKVSNILSDYADEYLDKTVDGIVALATGDESDEQTIPDAIEKAMGDPNLSALLPKLTSTVLLSMKDKKSARMFDELKSEVSHTLTDHFNSRLDDTAHYIACLATGNKHNPENIRRRVGCAVQDRESDKLVSKLMSTVTNSAKAKGQPIASR